MVTERAAERIPERYELSKTGSPSFTMIVDDATACANHGLRGCSGAVNYVCE